MESHQPIKKRVFRAQSWFFYGSTMIFCFVATGFIWYLSREVARFRDDKPALARNESLPQGEAKPSNIPTVIDELQKRAVSQTADLLQLMSHENANLKRIIRDHEQTISDQRREMEGLERRVKSNPRGSVATNLIDMVQQQTQKESAENAETITKLNTMIDDYKSRLSATESENRSLSDKIVQLKEKLQESEDRNLVRKVAMERENQGKARALLDKYSQITDETVTSVETWKQAQQALNDIQYFLVIHRLSEDHPLILLRDRLQKYQSDPVEYVRLSTGDIIIGRTKDVSAYTETFSLVHRGRVMGERSFDVRKIQARRMATSEEIK